MVASCPEEAYLEDLPFPKDLLGEHLEDHLEAQNLEEPYLAHEAASQGDLSHPLVAYHWGLFHYSVAYQEALVHLLEPYQEVRSFPGAHPFQVAYSYLVVHFEEIFLVNLVVDHPCPEAPCLVDQN